MDISECCLMSDLFLIKFTCAKMDYKKKKRASNQKCLTSLYNLQTRALKQIALESKWHLTNLEIRFFFLFKALSEDRTYLSLSEVNEYISRFPVRAVTRLMKTQSAVQPSIPLSLNSNHSINFFTDNILTIKERNIDDHLTDIMSKTFSTTDIYLDSFS